MRHVCDLHEVRAHYDPAAVIALAREIMLASTIQAETDRYISGPGQACSYKLGQFKIRELRERARQQLGTKFDRKTVLDEILSGGALPLDVLDARVDRWIRAQLAASCQLNCQPCPRDSLSSWT